MKAIGVRELKSKLSRYLRDVKDGETVLVTERGRVIAQICRPGRQRESGGAGQSTLEQLSRLLTVTRSSSNDPGVYPKTGLKTATGTAQRLIDQERDK